MSDDEEQQDDDDEDDIHIIDHTSGPSTSSKDNMPKKLKEKTTVEAEREERQRVTRLALKQKQFNGIVFNEEDLADPDTALRMPLFRHFQNQPFFFLGNAFKSPKHLKMLVLDPDSKSPNPQPVQVHPSLVRHVKPHQATGTWLKLCNLSLSSPFLGVKFLYDTTIEDLERLEQPGGGGLLAHCMGLGKTFQVITFLHTILTHPRIKQHIRRVLVVCPKNVILNWRNEFNKWLSKNDRNLSLNVTHFHRI